MKTQSMLMPKWALSLYQRGFDFKGNSWFDFGHSGCHTCNFVSYWADVSLCVWVWVWVGESVIAGPLTKTVFNIPMVGWQLQRQSKEKEDNCHALSPSCSQLLSPCTRTHATTHSYTHRYIRTLSEHRVKSELRLGTEMPLSGAHRDLPVAALGILTNSHIAWGHSCTQTEIVME